jgi:hypothetical protein
MPVIKASVIQACTASYGSPDSLALTLEKMEKFTALAKERDGSQLAVFPEALYVSLSRMKAQRAEHSFQHWRLSTVS